MIRRSLQSPFLPTYAWPAVSKRGALQIVRDEKKGGSDSKPFREAHEFLGDMGARDPFTDTEHLIAPPDNISKFIRLTSRKCKPCKGGNVPALGETEIDRLRNEVPRRMVVKDGEGSGKIRQEWKVKNFTAGLELFKRIAVIAEDQGHHPDLHLTGYSTVAAELSTHSVGGLTENDFIVAAQINNLDLSDLKKRNRNSGLDKEEWFWDVLLTRKKGTKRVRRMQSG